MKKKPRNQRVYIEEAIEAIDIALQHTAGATYEEFEKNIMMQDAVNRRVELVGEILTHVDMETKRRYRFIPWSQAIAMRNLLMHEYHPINLQVVWDAILFDLVALKKNLQKILQESDDGV